MKELNVTCFTRRATLGKQDKEFEAMEYVASRYAMGRRAATIRQHVQARPEDPGVHGSEPMEFNGFGVRRI